MNSPRQNSSATPRIWALIPCAGTGSRAGVTGAKQYHVVAGQPMVLHTLAAFAAVQRLSGVLVVVAADNHFFDGLAVSALVQPCGGATRAQSVCNGLLVLQQQGAQDNDWVLVHDAARCLITPEQIDALIEACLPDPVGGLLALQLPDTLKMAADGRVRATVSRSDKWLAQTPQMFRLGTLLHALQQVGDAATDESSAIEALGLHPLLVPGSAQNFKVTYPQDFALAETVLLSRKQTQ